MADALGPNHAVDQSAKVCKFVAFYYNQEEDVMLIWTEKYATGDSLIDSQHRMLITYVNQLEGLARTTNPSVQEIERFLKFIDFLEVYVQTHFEDEDACMYRSKCPAYEENKRGHGEFLDFFQGYNLRLMTEGWQPAIAKELHESCTAWVKRHIFRIDVQLRDSLPSAPD